jgi:hypothetical protein
MIPAFAQRENTDYRATPAIWLLIMVTTLSFQISGAFEQKMQELIEVTIRTCT